MSPDFLPDPEALRSYYGQEYEQLAQDLFGKPKKVLSEEEPAPVLSEEGPKKVWDEPEEPSDTTQNEAKDEEEEGDPLDRAIAAYSKLHHSPYGSGFYTSYSGGYSSGGRSSGSSGSGSTQKEAEPEREAPTPEETTTPPEENVEVEPTVETVVETQDVVIEPTTPEPRTLRSVLALPAQTTIITQEETPRETTLEEYMAQRKVHYGNAEHDARMRSIFGNLRRESMDILATSEAILELPIVEVKPAGDVVGAYDAPGKILFESEEFGEVAPRAQNDRVVQGGTPDADGVPAPDIPDTLLDAEEPVAVPEDEDTPLEKVVDQDIAAIVAAAVLPLKLELEQYRQEQIKTVERQRKIKLAMEEKGIIEAEEGWFDSAMKALRGNAMGFGLGVAVTLGGSLGYVQNTNQNAALQARGLQETVALSEAAQAQYEKKLAAAYQRADEAEARSFADRETLDKEVGQFKREKEKYAAQLTAIERDAQLAAAKASALNTQQKETISRLLSRLETAEGIGKEYKNGLKHTAEQLHAANKQTNSNYVALYEVLIDLADAYETLQGHGAPLPPPSPSDPRPQPWHQKAYEIRKLITEMSLNS